MCCGSSSQQFTSSQQFRAHGNNVQLLGLFFPEWSHQGLSPRVQKCLIISNFKLIELNHIYTPASVDQCFPTGLIQLHPWEREQAGFPPKPVIITFCIYRLYKPISILVGGSMAMSLYIMFHHTTSCFIIPSHVCFPPKIYPS